MKHIKTFESTNYFDDLEDNLKRLKKYLLLKVNSNISGEMYYILEILKISIEEDSISCSKKYIYRKLANRLKKGHHQYYEFTIDKFFKNESNILCNSDDIKDCLDIIPTLNQIDRYNL